MTAVVAVITPAHLQPVGDVGVDLLDEADTIRTNIDRLVRGEGSLAH